MRLGITPDGRELTYNQRIYEFRLANEHIEYDDVMELDAKAQIHWIALEQRDWFIRIDASTIADLSKRTQLYNKLNRIGGLSPEDQIAIDSAKDDSVIAGKIVNETETSNPFSHRFSNQADGEGLSPASLPKGMEPYSQIMNRKEHIERKMTPVEHLLMRLILKNDDKQKRKREAREAKVVELDKMQEDTKESENI